MKREILDVVFENERFTVGFTTRFGGVSEAAYEGLNLGDHVGDRAWSVAKNREILANRLGISVQNLKFMRQIHSNPSPSATLSFQICAARRFAFWSRTARPFC